MTVRRGSQSLSELSDDVLSRETRKVVAIGDTPYINPTRFGAQLLGLEKGDEVEVSVTTTELRIRRKVVE